MYLYQPCLLTMTLYAWGFETFGRRSRYLHMAFPLLLLAVSGWELSFTRLEVYPAALLLPFAYCLGRVRSVSRAEVLTSSFIGGLICWKIGDRWPLFWGTYPLCSASLLILAAFFCSDREDRFLACAIGSLLFELFFCLREYMLFSFCVVRLGSREALSLSASSICLYTVLEELFGAVHACRKHTIPIGN